MKRVRALAVATAAAAAFGLGAGIAVASTTTVVSFGQIQQVSQTRAGNADTTTSHSFVNLPGGSQLMKMTTSGILLARFSGESACRGSSGWCSVRMLVDGVEMDPVVGTDFAFDSPTTSGFSAHGLERSKVVQAGTHTVQVQFSAAGAATSFRLDDWTLTLESSAPSH